MSPPSSLRESLLQSEGTRPSRVCGCVLWQFIFFYNVFCACVAFSIVMPSLFLYLDSMGATASFYALVVAAYSFGEAIGSIVLGSVSNSFGIRRTLLLCTALSFIGACLYALATTAAGDIESAGGERSRGGNLSPGPLLVLMGRLIQGLGSGGQQAVEQSYLAIAARPEERTSMTGKLATFACMGFIFGPSFGAAVGALPSFRLGAIAIDAFTKVGWVCAVLNVTMFLGTWLAFTEVTRPPGGQGGRVVGTSERKRPVASSADSAATPAKQPAGGAGRGAEDRSSSLLGVWALNVFFLVHFNGFAIQETLTTPLVGDWFGWDEFEANLLFTAAGVANLLCAVLMSILTSPKPPSSSDGGGGTPSSEQRVDDRVLLFASLLLGLVGWLAMIPPYDWHALGPRRADAHPMGLPQFGIGFSIVTVCFPFGRGLCLAMVGKLLGDRPQGFWMGLMLALGAIARIVGPFWAVAGYYLCGTLSVFGSCALLFAASAVAMWVLWARLSPPPCPPGTPERTDPTSFFERQTTMLSSPRLISTPPSITGAPPPEVYGDSSCAAPSASDARAAPPPPFLLPPSEVEDAAAATVGGAARTPQQQQQQQQRRQQQRQPSPMAPAAEGPAKSLRRL